MRKLAPALFLSLLALIGCGSGKPPAVTDTISPSGPLSLDAGKSITLTASVMNDPSNAGVTWQLIGPTPSSTTFVSGIGTLSGQTATTVVYTAPPTVTNLGTVSIFAVPVANPNAGASTAISFFTPPTITTTTIATASVNAAYNVQLAATGGAPALSWSVSSGTLPAGITLTAAGLLTGTPTVAGSFPFTVTLTDASAVPGIATASYTLVVKPATLSITTTTTPNSLTGVFYTNTLTAIGGITPYTWALYSGTLPTGVSLSAGGVLSGTPTIPGNYTFTAQVTDTETVPQSARQTYSFTIYAPLAITTTSLPNGALHDAYTTTLQTSGGTTPITWSTTPVSGSLPAGLSLSSTGVISGTPTGTGNSTFTLRVTDASSPQQSATATYTLSIVLSTLAITTTTLPQGTITAPYTASLASSGGNAPVTWSLAPGSNLPTGLGLSTAGIISGTPSAVGNVSFTVQATDATPATVTQLLSINIVALATLTVSTSSLPAGNIGATYSTTLAATGGATPYLWSLAGGSLPPGLALSTTGVISGTPYIAGTSSFSVKVTDSEATAATATRSLTLTVGNTLPTGASNGLLSGGYAFLLNGSPNSSASGQVFGFAAIGSLNADAAGHITGVEDINTPSGVQQSLAVTGTYSLGTDGRGLMVLTAGTATTTYAIAASNVQSGLAQNIALTEFDNSTGTGSIATGFARRQTTAALAAATLNGTFAFGLSGESPCSTCATSPLFGPVAAAGIFTANGTTTITAGTEDAAAYGKNYTGITLAGAFTAPSATTGRGTLMLTPIGTIFAAPPSDFTYVIVSANELLLLSNDTHATTTLLYGDAQLQQQTTYSATSLAGRMIGYESQASGGDGTVSYPSALNAILTELTITGSGTATLLQDSNRAGVFATSSAAAITYTTTANGRTAIATGGSSSQVLYLYNTGAGFALDEAVASAYPALLQYEHQVATAPLPTLLYGSYANGTLNVPVPAAIASGTSTFSFYSGGTDGTTIGGQITTTTDGSTPAGLITFDQPGAYIYGEDLTGRMAIGLTSPSTPVEVLYAITNKRAVSIPTTSTTTPTVSVLQQ